MLQQVIVKTKNAEAVRPLLRSAIHREIKLLDSGIARTRVRLLGFEKQYNMTTSEFLRRFKADDLGETLDYLDWYGETKMLASLEEQKRTFEGTSVP